MTARVPDRNGWYEIQGNPISRVGVFDYLGSSCGGADPDRMYRVYRPAEELADPECVASFRLLPWVVRHAMLGPENAGLTPPEVKGIHGVIGENVYFDADRQMLCANIKVFSESMAAAIDAGMDELSAGYRCVYDWTPGAWNGEPYDCVQRQVRGNHLALIEEGRMGPQVAVMDHIDHFVFTFDAKELIPMADKPETPAEDDAPGGGEMTLAQVAEILGTIVPQIAKLNEAMASLSTPAAPPSPDEGTADEDDGQTAEDDGDPAAAATGMDAAEIKTLRAEVQSLKTNGLKTLLREVSQRDALADRLSHEIGTFDHREMTLGEVAVYGVKKLGLQVGTGQEIPALTGYLAARSTTTQQSTATGQDSKDTKGIKSLADYGV